MAYVVGRSVAPLRRLSKFAYSFVREQALTLTAMGSLFGNSVGDRSSKKLEEERW